MGEYTVPSMSDLFKTKTAEKLVEAANQQFTFPTGSYILAVTNIDLRPTEEDVVKFKDGEMDEETASWRLRHRASLNITATDKSSKRVGSLFADVSWVEKRGDSGRLDGQSQLWGQIVKALDMADNSVGEILEALKRYPTEGYIVELFKMPDGSYKTAKTAEDRVEFTKEGGIASNKLRSVRRLKY